MKKRILIIVFALLLITGVAGTFWGPDIANAAVRSTWNSCPKGKVNDYYPGDCHEYIDTNSDSICDLSQSNPAAVVAAVAKTTTSTATTPAAASATTITATEAANAVTTTDSGTATSEAGGQGSGTGTNHTTSYYFLPVALVSIALYVITWTLAVTKKIKLLTHRKIWNVILLVMMLISVLLGLERIILKDYGVELALPVNTLFWHVESSIVLGVIALFHIFWHWRYWVKLVKGKQEDKPRNPI